MTVLIHGQKVGSFSSRLKSLLESKRLIDYLYVIYTSLRFLEFFRFDLNSHIHRNVTNIVVLSVATKQGKRMHLSRITVSCFLFA